MGSEYNDDLEWEEWDPSQISFVNHMIAGSCAGLVEHIFMFPIDTLKTHVQCEKCGSTVPQTWQSVSRLIQREGIFRLWRGVSAMFAGCIPAHATYFSIYETLKRKLGMDQEGHYPIRSALCGATAALSHDMIMIPFDVVKQRMQLGYYRNVSHCIRTIANREGIRAFYVSLPTTLSMNIPYGCVMVAINESIRKVLNPSGEYSLSSSMIAGSIAGGCAAAITNPLDIIKTKLQTQCLEPCPNIKSASSVVVSSSCPDIAPTTTFKSGFRGAIDVAKMIYQGEGIKGFFRGAMLRVMVHMPSVAVSWSTYETVKNALA